MAGDGGTRRLLPAVLASLVLLLGLCAILGPAAFSSPAGSVPDSSTTVTAASVAGAHAAHGAIDPGPNPRLGRHADDRPLLTWVILLTAGVGGIAFGRWACPRSARSAPAARGRFTRDSRAPPVRCLPA